MTFQLRWKDSIVEGYNIAWRTVDTPMWWRLGFQASDNKICCASKTKFFLIVEITAAVIGRPL